jgi:cytochrome P450
MSIERYSVSSTSIVGWGRRIDRRNDYVTQQALKLMEGVNSVVPGVFIMETIPFLTKLPSWMYKLPSQISFGGAIMWRYFHILTEEGARANEDNFSKVLINFQEKQGLTDVEVGGLAGNFIGGGVDTTSSTLISCVLAMCAFPEVQRKAQAEIDSVVDPERSPTWDDVDGKLPYLVALAKGVLRWRSVAVLAGIPDANTKDVEYKGYRFPAGTNMIGNLWAIHRNPRDFPDPDNFRPERFLNGLEKPYPNAKGSNPLGWGRR